MLSLGGALVSARLCRLPEQEVHQRSKRYINIARLVHLRQVHPLEGSLLPILIRVYEQLRVVVAAVARHFLADEAGLCERLVLGAKLHLGNYESGVVAEELVDLDRVAPVG